MNVDRTYLDIFEQHFNNNLEEVILKLKEAGASQIDCVKVLVFKAKLSLKDADNIVLNSLAWKNEKNNTVNFRNKLGEFLENNPDIGSL